MTIPCDIPVFGGTGDLALHKLLPALYHLYREARLHNAVRIIALARRNLPRMNTSSSPNAIAGRRSPGRISTKRSGDVFAHVWTTSPWMPRKALISFAWHATGRAWRLGAHLLPGDRTQPVRAHRQPFAHRRPCRQRGAYRAGKPIGHSLESATAINEAIGAVFDESQVFRIDHYLGKETVQNLMALRFANALLEPVWRNGHVDHVQISVCETLGVENRGAYYDRAGATRDMLQNHLLQLLCLVAMEPPAQFEAEAVRDEKVKILRALKPITGQDVQDKTVRGQYGAGRIGGQEVPAYYFEKDVDNDSDTETFVAVQAHIDNWRWAGVPFYLRTGKRMARRSSQIVIQFKPVPHELFSGGQVNQLLIQLQPDERISLRMMTKSPGKGMRLEPVELDLNLAQVFGQTRRWEAYERLLLDVLAGDSTLFMRRDEVEAAWAWIDPILQGWEEHFQAPRPYPAGSNGPEQANSLLAHQGRHWHS